MKKGQEIYSQNIPYKEVCIYLEDIKEREKIIDENLKMISLSRETIEKLLCSSKKIK